MGVVGEVLAYDLVENAGAVLTAAVVGGGFVFFLTPLVLVVYSLVWAWPLVAMGNRAALSALFAFAVAVEATAGWFSVAVHTITNMTVLMRLLAVLTPVAFAVYAASAAWVNRGPSARGGQST